MARPLRALSVASEVFPLVKTGGLADVAGALPGALAAEGVEVRTLLPGYPAVLAALGEAETLHVYADLFGSRGRILAGCAGGLDVFALDAPAFYNRPGNIYVGDWPWADNARRFAALGRVAADIGLGLLPSFVPDVVHAHDWQAALAPVYLHYAKGPHPGTILTIHNLAFQGQFPASMLAELQLPPDSFTADGVEYYGDIGFLKSGVLFADRITTVSPTYAAEIRGAESGMGMEGLLRTRAADISGILNGLDTSVWNPVSDAALAEPFDALHLDARAANKRALQARVGLDPSPDAPLFGAVTRLTWQKGSDLLLEAVSMMVGEGAQLALLGSGDEALEAGFARVAAAHPGRVGIVTGYDEGLAHLIQAGSDCVLVPSRFEPCGLTQLSALRYGAPPLVSRVGGLADTVIDANEMALAAGSGTGFVFAPVTRENLEAALLRALAVWRDPPAWRQLQMNAMATDVGWTRSARHYAALYREVAPRADAVPPPQPGPMSAEIPSRGKPQNFFARGLPPRPLDPPTTPLWAEPTGAVAVPSARLPNWLTDPEPQADVAAEPPDRSESLPVEGAQSSEPFALSNFWR